MFYTINLCYSQRTTSHKVRHSDLLITMISIWVLKQSSINWRLENFTYCS